MNKPMGLERDVMSYGVVGCEKTIGGESVINAGSWSKAELQALDKAKLVAILDGLGYETEGLKKADMIDEILGVQNLKDED